MTASHGRSNGLRLPEDDDTESEELWVDLASTTSGAESADFSLAAAASDDSSSETERERTLRLDREKRAEKKKKQEEIAARRAAAIRKREVAKQKKEDEELRQRRRLSGQARDFDEMLLTPTIAKDVIGPFPEDAIRVANVLIANEDEPRAREGDTVLDWIGRRDTTTRGTLSFIVNSVITKGRQDSILFMRRIIDDDTLDPEVAGQRAGLVFAHLLQNIFSDTERSNAVARYNAGLDLDGLYRMVVDPALGSDVQPSVDPRKTWRITDLFADATQDNETAPPDLDDEDVFARYVKYMSAHLGLSLQSAFGLVRRLKLLPRMRLRSTLRMLRFEDPVRAPYTEEVAPRDAIPIGRPLLQPLYLLPLDVSAQAFSVSRSAAKETLVLPDDRTDDQLLTRPTYRLRVYGLSEEPTRLTQTRDATAVATQLALNDQENWQNFNFSGGNGQFDLADWPLQLLDERSRNITIGFLAAFQVWYDSALVDLWSVLPAMPTTTIQHMVALYQELVLMPISERFSNFINQASTRNYPVTLEELELLTYDYFTLVATGANQPRRSAIQRVLFKYRVGLTADWYTEWLQLNPQPDGNARMNDLIRPLLAKWDSLGEGLRVTAHTVQLTSEVSVYLRTSQELLEDDLKRILLFQYPRTNLLGTIDDADGLVREFSRITGLPGALVRKAEAYPYPLVSLIAAGDVDPQTYPRAILAAYVFPLHGPTGLKLDIGSIITRIRRRQVVEAEDDDDDDLGTFNLFAESAFASATPTQQVLLPQGVIYGDILTLDEYGQLARDHELAIDTLLYLQNDNDALTHNWDLELERQRLYAIQKQRARPTGKVYEVEGPDASPLSLETWITLSVQGETTVEFVWMDGEGNVIERQLQGPALHNGRVTSMLELARPQTGSVYARVTAYDALGVPVAAGESVVARIRVLARCSRCATRFVYSPVSMQERYACIWRMNVPQYLERIEFARRRGIPDHVFTLRGLLEQVGHYLDSDELTRSTLEQRIEFVEGILRPVRRLPRSAHSAETRQILDGMENALRLDKTNSGIDESRIAVLQWVTERFAAWPLDQSPVAAATTLLESTPIAAILDGLTALFASLQLEARTDRGGRPVILVGSPRLDLIRELLENAKTAHGALQLALAPDDITHFNYAAMQNERRGIPSMRTRLVTGDAYYTDLKLLEVELRHGKTAREYREGGQSPYVQLVDMDIDAKRREWLRELLYGDTIRARYKPTYRHSILENDGESVYTQKGTTMYNQSPYKGQEYIGTHSITTRLPDEMRSIMRDAEGNIILADADQELAVSLELLPNWSTKRDFMEESSYIESRYQAFQAAGWTAERITEMKRLIDKFNQNLLSGV